MLTALAILFWLIGGLLVLILVLICVPLHLRMTFRSEPTPAFGLELRLLTDWTPRLLLIDSRRVGAPRKKADAESEKLKPKKRKRKAARWWTSRLRPTELARAVPALLGDTLSGIHIDRLRVQAEFGFGDPADTGRIFGQLMPFTYLPISPAVSFNVKPNFESRCLKANADAALHFIPVRLALPAIRFAWQQFVVRS
ncbi:MAG: DUF2953 domain-containing protein [Rhodobacteraceae bacterium]|nr:DUF2953 domain-containing protein [Paracoccaceae bacterium]